MQPRLETIALWALKQIREVFIIFNYSSFILGVGYSQNSSVESCFRQVQSWLKLYLKTISEQFLYSVFLCYITLLCDFACLKRIKVQFESTVEALVSDHPRELKKVVATRTGRLREFDREIAQCRKNYLYVYTVFKLIFF